MHRKSTYTESGGANHDDREELPSGSKDTCSKHGPTSNDSESPEICGTENIPDDNLDDNTDNCSGGFSESSEIPNHGIQTDDIEGDNPEMRQSEWCKFKEVFSELRIIIIYYIFDIFRHFLMEVTL